MTLTADVQRFLWSRHFRQYAIDIADGDMPSRAGSFGGEVSFECYADGVGWALRGEDHHVCTHLSDWPHRCRWEPIVAHFAVQPKRLHDELHAARKAIGTEECRFWDACNAISKTGYWHADPRQRAELEAESRHNIATQRVLWEAASAALLALLPLGSDEPADLLEWAAALDGTNL